MKTCFECNFIYIYHSLSVEPETKKKGKRSASESAGSAGYVSYLYNFFAQIFDY